MVHKDCQLQEALGRYLETTALTLRPNTVAGYRSEISHFIRHLRKEHPKILSFSELERSHVETWLRRLAQSGLRRSTKRGKIMKVRAFLERMQAWTWKEAPKDLPFSSEDIPPPDRYLPKPLSAETDRALKKYLRQRDGVAARSLVPTALLLMRATGLRCQELLDLKFDALRKISEDRWSLHVPLGKLHTERVIPVDSDTAKVVEKICSLRGNPPAVKDPETGKRVHFLITRPNGSRPHQLTLRYHLRKAEERAQLKEHPTPHRLRHTYATEMLRAGMRLPVLMKLLGHRTIDMTLRYAEVTGVDVQRAYIETMASIEKQYEMPRLTTVKKPSTRKSARAGILSHVDSLAGEFEAYRRDYAKQSGKKRIQRLVERLRRLARDFDSVK